MRSLKKRFKKKNKVVVKTNLKEIDVVSTSGVCIYVLLVSAIFCVPVFQYANIHFFFPPAADKETQVRSEDFGRDLSSVQTLLTKQVSSAKHMSCLSACLSPCKPSLPSLSVLPCIHPVCLLV